MNLSQARFIILIILSATIFPFQVHPKMPSLTHPHPIPPLEGEGRTLSFREKSDAGSDSVYDRALTMYRRGEFREVIKLLRQKKTIDAGEANLLGWAYLKTGDAEEAIRRFSRSVSLAPSSYDSYCEFFAKGDYFWIRLKNDIKPFFIKGVNLEFGLPGKYPTEFYEDINTYLEWFRLIKEMNANVIRTYTILPPQFYKALRQSNLFSLKATILWILQ